MKYYAVQGAQGVSHTPHDLDKPYSPCHWPTMTSERQMWFKFPTRAAAQRWIDARKAFFERKGRDESYSRYTIEEIPDV